MAPSQQVERYSRREYFYQVESMLVGVADHLRKMFESRWRQETGQPWSNSPKQGREFELGIGQEVFEKVAPIQKRLLREGNLDKWDLSLIACVLRIVWNSSQYRKENANVKKLVDVRNLIEHSFELSVEDFNEKKTIIRKALTSLGVSHSDVQKLIDQAGTKSAAAATKKFHEMSNAANKFLTKKDIKKAVGVYDKVLMMGLEPGQISITHERRAECYLQLLRESKEEMEGTVHKLMSDVQAALKYNEQSWNAHLIAARCYRHQSKIKQALESYERALAISPVQKHVMKELQECRTKSTWIASTDFSDPYQMPMSSEEKLTIYGNMSRQRKKVTERELFAKPVETSEVIRGHEYMERGIMHENGLGNSKQCLKQAFKYFYKSAEVGYAQGIVSVGHAYALGNGVPQDLEKAREYFLKAANMSPNSPGQKTPVYKNIGVAGAQFELGLVYLNGRGSVVENIITAVEWFEKALTNGCCSAAAVLGQIYSRELHPIKYDMKKAEGYWKLGMRFKGQGAAKELVKYYQKELEPEMAASAFKTLQKLRLHMKCKQDEDDFQRKNNKVISKRAKNEEDVAMFEHQYKLSIKGLTFYMRLNRKVRHDLDQSLVKTRNDNVSEGLTSSCVSVEPVPKDPAPCNCVYNSETKVPTSVKVTLETKECKENLQKLLNRGKPFSAEDINKIVSNLYTCEAFGDSCCYSLEPHQTTLLSEVIDGLFKTKCHRRGDEDMKIRFCYVSYNLRLCAVSTGTMGIELLKVGMKRYPDNQHYYEKLCYWYMSMGQYQDGLELIKLGLKRFPNNANLLYYRAIVKDFSKSYTLSETLDAFDDFLKVVPRDHPGRPKVYYIMSKICITKLPPQRKNREKRIKIYFDMGEEAEKDQLDYPSKLYPVSPIKMYVANHLKRKAKSVSPTMDQDEATSDVVENEKQTGYLTSSERIKMIVEQRLKLDKKLCLCENCDYQKSIGVLAAVFKSQETFPFSLNSGKIRIQEMVSTEEKVYENRWMDLLIIEDPCITTLSISLLVEDDYGDVARLAVFSEGFNDDTVKLFGFGKTLVIFNPFMGSIQNGLNAIQEEDVGCIMFMEEKDTMCRFCGEERAKFTCGKCNRANYCSKECQEQDWKIMKHKIICCV